MVQIIENRHLEDILSEEQNLQKIFVVAQRRADNFVDSAAVCLFDERGILHVIDAVDTHTPHLYYASVPVEKDGHYAGNLDQTLIFGNNRNLIGNSKLGNGLRAFTNENRVPNIGDRLLARRAYLSPEITKALKEASETLPIIYRLERPESLAEKFLFGSKEAINIKSVLRGGRVKTESLLNILPSISNSTKKLRQEIRPRQTLFQLSNFVLSVALFSTSVFRLNYYPEEERDVNTDMALGVGSLVSALSAVYSVVDDEFASESENFYRCLKFLEERTRRNKELSDLSYDLTLAERNGNVLAIPGAERESQMKRELPRLRNNRINREENENTQVAFEFSDFKGEKIEDVRDQVRRFHEEKIRVVVLQAPVQAPQPAPLQAPQPAPVQAPAPQPAPVQALQAPAQAFRLV